LQAFHDFETRVNTSFRFKTRLYMVQ